MKSFTLLIAFLIFGRFSAPTIEAKKEAIFTIVDFGISKRLILTEAEVDHKKGLFLFDTGASHLTLNEKHFPEKKIYTSNYQTSTILASNLATRTTEIDAFAWGDIQREQLECPVADLSSLEKSLGYPILGLIGYNIIQDFEVHLDYKNGIITLASGSKRGQVEAAPPDYTLDFSLCGHMPVIETRIGKKNRVYLGLDTGASINVLNDNWQDDIMELAIDKNKIAFTGVGIGQKTADRIVVDQITLDDQITWQNAELVMTNFSVPTGKCFRVDGIIGIDMLVDKRMVIDYKKFKLYVWENEVELPADVPK